MPGNDTLAVNVAVVKLNGTNASTAFMNAVISIEVDNTLDMPDMATIRLHNDNTNKVVDDAEIKPGVEVEISMGDNQIDFDGNGAATVIFKGEIVALEPDFAEFGLITFTLRCYDKRHRMNRQTQSQAFVQKKDSDIVTTLAGEAGLQVQAEDTLTVHEHVFMRNQKPLAFIQMLADRNGFEVACEQGKLLFRKPATNSSPVATLIYSETLMSFRPRISLANQVNEVVVHGWDSKKQLKIVGTSATSNTQPNIGFGKWGGQAAQSAFSGAAKHYEVMRSIKTQAEANALAKSILDDINSNSIVAEGKCLGNTAIKAGTWVKIQDLGTRFSGAYPVTSVTHVYEEGRYLTYFRSEGRHPKGISELMGGGASGQSSAIASASPSRQYGAAVGIVTDIADPDNAGRVKVKFPWIDDNIASNWARLVAPGAGNDTGFFFLPEVNDEVLVLFEHGNFDYPYVIGGVYSTKNKPPEATNAVASGKVKTHIMKLRDGTMIKHVTTSDKSVTTMQDKDGVNKLVMDQNAKKTNIETTGDVLIKSTGKTEVTATGDVAISGKAVKMESQANMDIKAGGVLNLKGATVNIN
jgi:uncharacterized protein involved in type VI secretion and phage assembly